LLLLGGCTPIGTPAYTAIVNGVAVDQPLEAGMLLKISREEPYRTERDPPDAR